MQHELKSPLTVIMTRTKQLEWKQLGALIVPVPGRQGSRPGASEAGGAVDRGVGGAGGPTGAEGRDHITARPRSRSKTTRRSA
jgi:hypothetical protein